MLQHVLEATLRQTMQRLVRPLLTPAVPVRVQRILTRQAYRSSIPPRGCHFEQNSIADVPVTRTRYGSAQTAPSGQVILYLHGGGYIIGSATTHRGITGHLARASGALVVTPDYRLAPEHVFPAALDDALAVYRGLIGEGFPPAAIAVAGDSAGGGLTLALAMRLRDENLPLPGSLVVFSPWTDLSHSQLYRPDCEPVLQAEWIEKAARLYCGNEARSNPLISPVFGDLSGLPPLLIQVGSQEILLNDATRLAETAKQQNVDTTLEIYNSLWHVFQVHAGQLSRATRAIETAGKHIRRHMPL